VYSIALSWFSSYLAGRKQRVRCGGKSSSITDVVYGVPQLSVLGPILFIIYTADLAPIVANHGLSLHQYADDSQIYGSCPPAATSSLSTDISLAVGSVLNWMRSNRLQLKAEKTEVMWYASAHRQSQLPRCPTTFSPLSVTWASTSTVILTPPPMYVEPCRAVSPHCDSFVIYVATLPTTAFVLSWSRPSNQGSIMATLCLLGFLPIFNDVCSPYSTAQLAWYSDFVATTTCHDALAILHWLRLLERVNFKLAFMAYRVLNSMAPPCLNQLVLISRMPGRRRLRSSFTLQLYIPQYRLSTAGRRSFPVEDSIFWNTLSDYEQSAPSVSSFRRQLKTFLFYQSFPDIIV